ncbi:hypothetical protein J6590_017971 [Homalodisca vitripennis]|nr:hypothetical protein J6590_017971 [Homalodisca vitripennis]
MWFSSTNKHGTLQKNVCPPTEFLAATSLESSICMSLPSGRLPAICSMFAIQEVVFTHGTTISQTSVYSAHT